MSIWTITERDIYQLRGAGGELFLEFCDALLRAELSRHGIPAINIATNQRSTKSDGGVDTKIDVPVPDSHSGWLASSTSWQYKGTDASGGALGEASLKSEIHKPFNAELIRRGFAYRFTICDDVPPDKREEVDAFLTREARILNPDAPQARLVTAGDLAAWASRYFALKVRFFNSELEGLLTMSSWRPNITEATRTYVALQDRSETFAAIRTHASLDRMPNRVDMVLEGEPGIGKTRLAYEALMHEGADQLVLYTSDERAATMAVSTLANSDSAGILVADECSDLARVSMASTLSGHRARVRLICINAPTPRSPFDGEQPWLAKMSTSDVDEILRVNFPEVSTDHRFAYRDLARGYIRLAIDLCQNDRVITERGLSVALRSVDDYLITRLSGGQLEAALAVSLFQRVGFRDDVADELASVAQLLALSLDELHQHLRVIRNGPGFVAEAGRYYYVTPTIVAETLFARAWEKWAAGRDSSFLERAGTLPKELFDSFLKRVSINAPPEVRRTVGEYFRQSLNVLTGLDLRDDQVVRRAAVLVEAHPKDAKFLSAALAKASDEEVQAISGAYGRGWGPRRTLVWLAEKLARYPTFFHDAELILWRLASNENETVGNNATELWRQLFRVYLSGAATPFAERVLVLRDRVETARGSQVSLAIGALTGILSDWLSRSGGMVYVGGRLAPEDWQPQTYGEFRSAYADTLALLRDQLASPDNERQTLAKAVLTKSFWFLLSKGLLRDSLDLIESARFDEMESLGLVRLARDYVSREGQPSTPEEKEYLDVIISWIDGRLRSDGHQRALTDYLTQDEFQTYQETTKSSTEQAEELRHSAQLAAKALISDSTRVERNVGLVSASNPYRAAVLGTELGHLDSGGTFFGPLLKECLLSSRSSLIGGYISARASDSRGFVDVLNSTIDQVTETSPQLAFELSNAAPRDSNALERAQTWVKMGVLVPAYLRTFMFGVQGIPLSADETLSLLRTLIEHPDRSARIVAIEILGYLTKADKAGETPFASEAIQAVAWHLVEDTVAGVPAHNWADVVTMLAKVDAARATGLAIRAMLVGDSHLESYAERLSIELASRDPEQSLLLLGEALVGVGVRPRLLINTCRPFVKSLPLDLTKQWLGTVQIEVVRRFARNLEAPYLSSEGEPAVPPLTEHVLREFEGDDKVFESFYSGTHHLRAYSGDVARRHAAEAAMAERFRNHPLRRVREWAEMEVERGTRWAEMWSQRNAEERSEEM
jgi:hypothetical protein